MLSDTVNDFKEVECEVLLEIVRVMEENLCSYSELVHSPISRLSIVLDSIFSSTGDEDKSFLRDAIQAAGIEMPALEGGETPRKVSFYQASFDADGPVVGSTGIMDEVGLFFQATVLKESPTTDLLNLWKLNQERFPNVARVARDVPSAQASSVASESAFSCASCVVDSMWTNLSDESITSLLLLQSWRRFMQNYKK